jgi:LAGLIDADG endonuclease
MKLEAGWVVGFVDGEGCFHVGVHPHPDMAVGYQVLPEFTVVQHERDAQLLQALKAFFGCGVVRRNHGDRMAYRVRGLEHLSERIVPFFLAHPLKSSKRVDFLKFRRVVLMMERGEHLTAEGIEAIRTVASQMNRGRSRESPAPSETAGVNPSEIPCRVSSDPHER